MNAGLKKFFSSVGVFFHDKRNRRLTFLAVICFVAFGEFLLLGLVRRTFVFYSIIDGAMDVEDRMLHRSPDGETDIRRYVEEVLLGPVSPDSAPLFARETRLSSFMYRDGVAYADLTEPAVFPVAGDVFRSLLTLNEGIRRNFPKVKDVRLFIGGNKVFFEEFRRIFMNSADNRKTAL